MFDLLTSEAQFTLTPRCGANLGPWSPGLVVPLAALQDPAVSGLLCPKVPPSSTSFLLGSVWTSDMSLLPSLGIRADLGTRAAHPRKSHAKSLLVITRGPQAGNLKLEMAGVVKHPRHPPEVGIPL